MEERSQQLLMEDRFLRAKGKVRARWHVPRVYGGPQLCGVGMVKPCHVKPRNMALAIGFRDRQSAGKWRDER
jgi:hypothetical protein